MSDKAMSLADARKKAIKASPARERLTALFDPDTFVEVGAFVKNGCDGAGVVTGYGLVEGSPVYAFSQDSAEKSGAVGQAHGSKIKKLYDLALKTGAPVVGIYDSNGAAVDEGLDAMAAYGDLLCWTNSLSGVVPQVSLVLGVCAGSAAMIAASADFVVMSDKGEFFLNVGDMEKSSAQDAAAGGVAHIVKKSEKDAIAETRRLLSLLPSNNLSVAPMCDFKAPESAKALQAAANGIASGKGGLFDAACKVADMESVLELQADYGKNVRVALATMAGATIGIVATDAPQLCPACCSKAARFVSICDAFQIPVVTFVDCEGFNAAAAYPAGVREIAKLAHVYAEATTPKVAVVAGKAYGAAFVALAGHGANADYVVAWPGAVISALPPQTAVAFLEGDKITKEKSRQQIEAEYVKEQATALAAAARGNIDDVIDPAQTREVILSALDMLSSKRVSRLPKKHANIPM